MTELASRQQLWLAYMRWAIVTVPLVLLLGFASARSVVVGNDNAWYAALTKPDVTPPDWLFPVAWTSLYIMLGLAAAIVINARGSKNRGLALTLFAVQLGANLGWTPVFFGAHRVFWAVIIIAAMLVLSIATTLMFGRIRRAAAWLFVPYLVWISFAGVLTFRIAQLNPNAETLVPSVSSSQIIG